MMSPEANDDAIITLKNKPEVNEELREQYPEAIIPGYYANKTHWNSIRLAADEVTDEQIEQLILTSYELVYQKLTKNKRRTNNALKRNKNTNEPRALKSESDLRKLSEICWRFLF